MPELDEMREKKPWPTKDAMQQVYDLKLWGGGDVDFYSGEGSHLDEIVVPYITAVKNFLSSFSESLTVCDLGCGDFNIGNQLFSLTKSYVGIDIVPELIERNRIKFQSENLSFESVDIASHDLPKAECVIIRQVLQHLSNAEVMSVVSKLGQYKYIILTEHIPVGEFQPNIDIISGQGIRIKKGSGLDVTQPPFNLQFHESKELCSFKLNSNKGRIVTTLYRL